MKKLFQGAVAGLLLVILNLHSTTVRAQGTAFTYQGRLNSSGSPASGSYDLVFSLYGTNTGGMAIAPPVTNSAIAVTNGLFTTLVNFGPGAFTGGSNWLQIAVSTNSANSFSTLTPRQQLTPVPYAVLAGTASNVSGTVSATQLTGAVASANLSGTYGNAVTLNNAGNSFTGNGAGLVSLNASALSGGTITDALLSANVALLNANQTFTGVNTFAGANQGLIVNGGPVGMNLFTGLGLQYNPGSGEAAIISSLNDNRSFLTFYTKQGPGVPAQQQMKIDRNGVVMIDDQANNNGVLNDGTTNGASLVFGGNSGEGIASQRTSGVNQYGLDFYTGRTRQMSILNNGNIGMGVTNPGTALQVSGTVTATGVSVGSGGLMLPATASITSAGNPLLFADTYNNSYFGLNAGNPATGSSNNVAVGSGALAALTNGSENVALGSGALGNVTSDSQLVAIGYQALMNDNAAELVYGGPVFYGQNTAIGFSALQADTVGADNTAVGFESLKFNTNGYGNTAIGGGGHARRPERWL